MRGKREKQDRQDRKTGIKVIAHEIQGRRVPPGLTGPAALTSEGPPEA